MISLDLGTLLSRRRYGERVRLDYWLMSWS
jgi:hypothetical protein